MARSKSNWNIPLLIAGLVIYGALLLLFGWQTWQFVNWLFPDDQLLAKLLTMLSFDVLAAFWAVVHTFFRFKSRGAKHWVQIAWAVTFILSLVASVLYLVIQFFFRFQIGVSPAMVNFGYAVSIIALVFNILALMSWLILEHRARNPRQDEFEDEQEFDKHDYTVPYKPRSTDVPGQDYLTLPSGAHIHIDDYQRLMAGQGTSVQQVPLVQAPSSNNNQNGH